MRAKKEEPTSVTSGGVEPNFRNLGAEKKTYPYALASPITITHINNNYDNNINNIKKKNIIKKI